MLNFYVELQVEEYDARERSVTITRVGWFIIMIIDLPEPPAC
jgi:hypothetical protein